VEFVSLNPKPLLVNSFVPLYIFLDDLIWLLTTINTNLYQDLVDSMHSDEGSAENVGRRIVLSSSFIGGPHDMRHWYMDAMALGVKV
jgi:hypothetical protein